MAYDYPPSAAPGAGVRTAKFVRHLPEFGWRATVIARCEDGRDSTREGDVLRVRSFTPTRLSYQLSAWGWAPALWLRARRLLATGRFDLLFVSCPPFGYSLAAHRLQRGADLPLVVDFRDAWSLDPYESGGLPKRWLKRGLRRWVYLPAERRVLRAADAFIANTPSMRREYTKLGFVTSAIELVPNGFDEDDFRGLQDLCPPPRDELSLLYLGRFAGIAGRSPELVLGAVRALVDHGLPVALRVLGDQSTVLRAAVERLGLSRYVSLQGPLSHRAAVREMMTADALVLYQAPGRTPISAVAGKTYEYLRSGRPILAIVPAGDNADLLRRYGGPHTLISECDVRAVERAALALYARWKNGSLAATTSPSREFLQRFDRRALSRQLAALFDRVLASRSSEG